MGFLYTCQTTIDLIVLIFTLFVYRSGTFIYGYSPANISDSICRASAFLHRLMMQSSSWMSVFIIFDRFIFVLYEHRFKFMKSKLILSAIMCGIFILLAIADIENLFFYLSASFSCTANNEVTVSSNIINIVIGFYIPLAIIILFDTLMIRQIIKKRKVKIVRGNDGLLFKKEHYFTVAVISCTVLFFISKFPLSIYYISYDINLFSGNFKIDQTLNTMFSLYFNLLVSLSYFNLTFSVFMYLAFNKLFLKEFCRLFLFCFSRFRSDSSVGPSGMSVRINQINASVRY